MSEATFDSKQTSTDGPGKGGERGIPSVPHSDEDWQLAYEVWRTDGAQNATLTASILTETHGVTIPHRTLARWVQADDWSRPAAIRHGWPVSSTTRATAAP